MTFYPFGVIVISPLLPNSRHPGGVPQHSWDFFFFSNQRLQPLSLPSRWELAQEKLWEWGKQGWIQLELLILAALPSLPGHGMQGRLPGLWGKNTLGIPAKPWDYPFEGILKEFWRQILVVLEVEARLGSAPRASLWLSLGFVPGILLFVAIPDL